MVWPVKASAGANNFFFKQPSIFLTEKKEKLNLSNNFSRPTSLNIDKAVKLDPVARYKMQSIDLAVKAHEQAHLQALGPYAAGPIQYSFAITAEGQRYAVGGSIAVDLKPVVGDPEATLRKAKAVLQAALSPVTPSGADKQVAAEALRLIQKAKQEIAKEKTQALNENEYSQVNSDKKIAFSLLEPSSGLQTEEALKQAASRLKYLAFQSDSAIKQAELLLKAYQLEIKAARLAHKEKLSSKMRIDLLI